MVRVSLVSAHELDAAELSAWHTFQGQDLLLRNPRRSGTVRGAAVVQNVANGGRAVPAPSEEEHS
ncbi:hypothetical protein [Nonomuraea sp. SYSU D8015]|uniref:hypothetical protein n=1 Tax=Nonomuraea sp. SYSU D8015 TaxID=2593644 RepID=UPI0016610BEF|nr:hypothetical protein [Nonomuraea sp. SYSU D8015]